MWPYTETVANGLLMDVVDRRICEIEAAIPRKIDCGHLLDHQGCVLNEPNVIVRAHVIPAVVQLHSDSVFHKYVFCSDRVCFVVAPGNHLWQRYGRFRSYCHHGQ